MMEEQNFCVQCYESITNPVCEKCHMEEVKIWLQDTGLDSMTKSVILTSIKSAMPIETMNENVCILCDKSTLSTCSYCFFLISARVLKELNLGKEIIEHFLESFNYRLGHSEYAI